MRNFEAAISYLYASVGRSMRCPQGADRVIRDYSALMNSFNSISEQCVRASAGYAARDQAFEVMFDSSYFMFFTAGSSYSYNSEHRARCKSLA